MVMARGWGVGDNFQDNDSGFNEESEEGGRGGFLEWCPCKVATFRFSRQTGQNNGEQKVHCPHFHFHGQKSKLKKHLHIKNQVSVLHKM